MSYSFLQGQRPFLIQFCKSAQNRVELLVFFFIRCIRNHRGIYTHVSHVHACNAIKFVFEGMRVNGQCN